MVNFQAFQNALRAQNITLPTITAPVASYVPFKTHNTMLFISGQLPLKDGAVITGKLGQEISLEQGIEAARLCGLNILAHINTFLKENPHATITCLKLSGFVAATPDFHDAHKVMNGASNLMHQILGDDGLHARAAVGVAALPLNACVEVEALFGIN